VMVGRAITRVETRRPDLRFPLPDRFSERVTGAKIEALNRRAKYLVAELSTRDALVMHLGMTGRFTVSDKRGSLTPGSYIYETSGDPKHDHVVIALKGGALVTYNDPRRFGFMILISDAERATHPLFRSLGAEPLSNDLNAEDLAARARGRKVNLKTFLMDQRNVAGLGNIYVSEALHRAGLSPNRRAASLADAKSHGATDRAERLVASIRSVLEDAIAAGGSTLRDYRAADGRSGAFQESFAVYDRASETCVRKSCGGVIRRVVQGQRATFYCPRCQK
jgi:formamidopyrimidine-DNA glycosylase